MPGKERREAIIDAIMDAGFIVVGIMGIILLVLFMVWISLEIWIEILEVIQ